jgi:hypothetical protein
MLNQYFAAIKLNCGLQVGNIRKMDYFHEESILYIGYLMSYVGVYLGALYRHRYHGL